MDAPELHAPELPLFEARVKGRAPRPMKRAQEVRVRLKELLRALGISQTDLCERLNAEGPGKRWRLSRLNKLLNGHIPFGLDDLQEIADAAGLSMVELVRQSGREFVGDLTPTELRILQLLRENPSLADLISAVMPERRAAYRAQLKARADRLRARIKQRDDD